MKYIDCNSFFRKCLSVKWLFVVTMAQIVLQSRTVRYLIEHEQPSDQFKNTMETLLLKRLLVMNVHVESKYVRDCSIHDCLSD
jgi:hypothetical protein